MTIDFSKDAADGLRATVLRLWQHDGHEVALVQYERSEPTVLSERHLVCECDYDSIPYVVDGKTVGVTHRSDPHTCVAKAAVRETVVAEMRPSCLAVKTRDGLDAAVLDMFTRNTAGEYFGQHYPSMLYAQNVAAALEENLGTILQAIDRLFAAEKLDLNGMILTDYVQRFRFPKEIQWLFAMMIEEPLGWPNGDAGDGFIYTLESAIHEHTRFKSGRQAFYEHNYPRVSPHHLLQFGERFLQVGLARAHKEPEAAQMLRYTDLGTLAKTLEDLASKLREFGKERGYPEPFPNLTSDEVADEGDEALVLEELRVEDEESES